MNWLRSILFLYGGLNIIGGIIGLVAGKSIWSAIIGIPAGLIVIALTIQATTKPAFAYRALGGVAIALACFWVYRITEVGAQGKSPMMAIMNLALSVGVFGCLGYSHMAATKSKSA